VRIRLAAWRQAIEDGYRWRYVFLVGAEPVIVVGDRKELTYLLCQAAELEHGLMCEYLYAAFSLKGTAGPGLRADQLAAVERWRGMIFGIAAEEMLPWAMVQNLLTAVGSAPYVSRPHMPHQAKGYPPGVQVRLLPFGEAALQHFVYLERPEGDGRRRRRGLRARWAAAVADEA
jgi:ferritin-like protein